MERCSFFNAELNGETYDRVYLAEDFARYFSSFIGNGVFPNPATGLQVIADNKSMNVIIKPGKAWINGYFYENTDDLTLQVSVADGVLNRIDKVVLRLDFLNREIKTYIKQGNFASIPVVPALTRNADIYELALADIRINKGTIKIDQAAITDLRFNKELCGFVKGTIEEIDTTGLFTKFEQGYEAWFEYMKGTIEGDAAANLTTKVYELNSKLDKKVYELNAELDTKATKDGTLQTNLNAEKLGGKLVKELTLKKDFDIIANKATEMYDKKGVKDGIATLNSKGRLAQNIDVINIVGNPHIEKKEIIAQGSLSATGLGEGDRIDSQVVPIKVGEWASISIKINYILHGHLGVISEIILSNTVDGGIPVTLKEDVEIGHDQRKTGTYHTTNGIHWITAEVNSIMDIYKNIGDTRINWGSLQDNKTNVIYIAAKRSGDLAQFAGNETAETVGAVVNYTIEGIRRSKENGFN